MSTEAVEHRHLTKRRASHAGGQVILHQTPAVSPTFSPRVRPRLTLRVCATRPSMRPPPPRACLHCPSTGAPHSRTTNSDTPRPRVRHLAIRFPTHVRSWCAIPLPINGAWKHHFASAPGILEYQHKLLLLLLETRTQTKCGRIYLHAAEAPFGV